MVSDSSGQKEREREREREKEGKRNPLANCRKKSIPKGTLDK